MDTDLYAAGRLYVLDASAGRILSMGTDGSNGRVIVTGCRMPDGIVVDADAGHVYWTNMGVPNMNDGSIERADVDGRNRRTIVPQGGTFTTKQLQLDRENRKLYWSDREGMRVMRANLDGSQLETLVETGRGDADRRDATRWCVGVGVDAARRQLYWTQKGPDNAGLIDRTNHHLFQPLLYQVATSVLTPGQIGTPIRSILRKQRNTTVILAEVIGVNKEQRHVIVSSADHRDVSIAYDYLILATGGRHSYFGNDEFERFAPGLKTLADAVAIRNRILQAFEQAEAEEDPSRRRELLTFVLVGAGPTGVELAGALAVLVRTTLRSEFRRIDPRSARIVLVDMAPRVLGSFSDDLSAAARRRLERLGVELRLGHGVDHIAEDGVIVAGERIASRTVVWTAGPSPAGKWLGVAMDRAGRVEVRPDLSVPGHPEIFVIGDTAVLRQEGRPLPGVAQVAMQQGRYAGRLIARRVSGKPAAGAFRYFDKGNMAVVGKGFAVLQSGRVHLAGFVAWLVWAAVHLQFLGQSSLRVSVFVQWVWTYLTGQRGSQLIVNHHCPVSAPAAAVVVPRGAKVSNA